MSIAGPEGTWRSRSASREPSRTRCRKNPPPSLRVPESGSLPGSADHYRSADRSGLRVSTPADPRTRPSRPVCQHRRSNWSVRRYDDRRPQPCSGPPAPVPPRHPSGMIRLLGCPIPERRPEAVRHGRDLEPCEQSTQMLFHDRLPAADGEDNRTAVAERPGLVEDVDGAAA